MKLSDPGTSRARDFPCRELLDPRFGLWTLSFATHVPVADGDKDGGQNDTEDAGEGMHLADHVDNDRIGEEHLDGYVDQKSRSHVHEPGQTIHQRTEQLAAPDDERDREQDAKADQREALA